MHADYTYYPETHITEILARHPEITRDDISMDREWDGSETIWSWPDPETGIPVDQVFLSNSVDQEYYVRLYEVEVWEATKGSETNAYLDYMSSLLAQPDGEEQIKSMIRSISAYRFLSEY